MIANAIDTNEASILSEVISLLKQLLPSGEAAPDALAEPPVMEAMEEETDFEEVDVKKATVDETGDTKAEDRLANQTDTTDQSLQDLGKVKKALTELLAAKQPVQKSQQNSIVTAVNQLTALMQTVVKSQQEQAEFNRTISQALGASDDIIQKAIVQPQANVTKSRPVQSVDTAAVVQQVFEGLFKNMPQLNQPPAQNNKFNNDRRTANKDLLKIVKRIGGIQE